MNLLDANVLIALHRADHEHHEQVTLWFDEMVAAGTAFGSPDLCWVACLRLCTNPRVFVVPSPIALLDEFHSSVRQQEGYVSIVGSSDHLAQTMSLVRTRGATGNLVNDAYLASFGVAQGWTIVSLDHDFARFTGVGWIDPRRDI
jgi:uncharacterized protein